MGETLLLIDGMGLFDELGIAHAGLTISAVDFNQGSRPGLVCPTWAVSIELRGTQRR